MPYRVVVLFRSDPVARFTFSFADLVVALSPHPPPLPGPRFTEFFFFLPSFCSAAPALVGVSVAWPSLIVCFCQFAVGGGRSGRRGAFGAAPLVVAAVAGAQHVGRHSKPSRHRLQPTGSHT